MVADTGTGARRCRKLAESFQKKYQRKLGGFGNRWELRCFSWNAFRSILRSPCVYPLLRYEGERPFALESAVGKLSLSFFKVTS